MGIDFTQIPSNIRVPFVAVEFNASNANQGPTLLAYQGLIIGQKTSAGAAAANSVVQVNSVADAIAAGGRGSMLHRMALAWFASNKSTPLFLGVLADNSGGVAAQGTITVAGPATAAGTIALYLGGVQLSIGVNSADTASTIAANIAAAINAALDLPVTASATGAVVTVTFRHKGLVGNTFDMRDSFNDGQALPAGVTLTYVAMGGTTAGTTNPVLTTLIATMATMWFQVWAHPYTDATSLTAIENELASRSGPTRAIDGLAVTSLSGSFSTYTTLGESRNSQFSSIVAQPGDTPLTPPMEFAAEVAALVAASASADPALPFQTLAMSNAIAVPQTDEFTFSERNLFLFDGIATTKVGPGGVVQLERIITTYQLNTSSQPDISYLDATTVFNLMYLRYDFRNRITTKYPRVKLAPDGTRFASGQAVITPQLAKGECLMWFREKMEQGLVVNFDAFKQNLVVQIDASNPSQLDFLLPPQLISQLIVAAAQIQFVLNAAQ